jgi:hypothetical protein
MTRAIAFAATQIDRAEWARRLVVVACALTLILADRALPALSL